MVIDACLETFNWRGKENMHPASRTRRIIVADELLFLLLWSSGYVGLKIGLSLSGTFSLLFFRFVIAVLLVGAPVSSLQYFLSPVTMLIAWPAFGAAFSRVGFVGLLFTAGGFLLIYLYEQARTIMWQKLLFAPPC
jgi:hypothetical protein